LVSNASAAAGDTTVKDRLLKGGSFNNKNFKVHLDGFNQLPYLTGQQERGARDEFFYFNDDGDLVVVRFDVLQAGATVRTAWKVIFCEQRQPGQFDIWANPFTCFRVPRMFNLWMDPYEHAQVSGDNYDSWRVDNAYLVFEASRRAAVFLQTFLDYPPSQTPASFSIDQIEAGIKEKLSHMQQKPQ
jgi:arylsulfatase